MKIFLILLTVCAFLDAAPAAAQEKNSAVLLEVNGAIGPATSDYFERSLEKARESGAKLIILRMDTPGGLDTSMREINKAILTSSIPVVTYIAPDGARAASAGTYILYASHIAAMAPATNLGAATPVQIGGGLPGMDDKDEKDPKKDSKETQDTLNQKAVNDAKAYIRGLAQKRGRNVEWAEQAVEKAESLSAQEALKLHVIDLIAENVDDLLKQLHGKKVQVLEKEVTLNTASLEILTIKPDWRNRLLGVISNPNIAYILLLIGIYGLIFEFMNPGYILPGVAGAICLLLGLYALHVLPVNYAGAALLLLGIALMVVEAFVPSFGALGIGGIAAFVIGSLMLIESNTVPEFKLSRVLIGSFALVSGVFFFVVLGMAVKARRRKVVTGAEEMIGADGYALEDIETQGNVFIHGEVWQATSKSPLKKGQELRVLSRSGLQLQVEPITSKPMKED
jgi:membrane-bound serine protease (ClpP class)